MLITINDLYEIVKIGCILAISSFGLYLPVKTVTRNSELAIKLTIPISISIQILFGYFFYCLAKMPIYPISYLGFILLINSVTLIKLRPSIKLTRMKLDWKLIVGGSILVIAVIYHFFYDGATSYAPGTIDTINHVKFLFKDLQILGYLSFPTYPPGFHILTYPLTLISSAMPVYRFTGPIIGLITLLSIVFSYRDILKHKISIVFLIGILLFPIFNSLSQQLVGFFPTGLSFIFVIFMLSVIFDQKLSIKAKWILSLIVFGAMALTIPYLTVQMVPSLIVLLIFSFFNFKTKKPNIHRSIVVATVGLIFSFAIAFAHVYIQGSVLARTSGFPAIETVEAGNDNLVVETTYQKKDDFVQHLPNSLEKTAKNRFVENYILPMVIAGTDIIKIKNIRELNGALSIGAYALIAIAVGIIIFKRKEANLTILSVFVVVFGTSVQTGTLEISTYRGRSGYYMLLFSVLLIASLIDHYYRKKYRWPLMIFIALSIVASLIQPPTYYRNYYPEYFEVAQRIIDKYNGENIQIKTNRLSLASLSPMIKTEGLTENISLSQCNFDRCFLILEKRYLYLDPVLSQRSYAADKGASNFLKLQEESAQAQDKLNKRIMELPEIKNAGRYFENDNLLVYEFSGQ